MSAAEPQAESDRRAARIRCAVYGLLIALATGNMTGRILAVNAVDVIRLEEYRIQQRLGEKEEELAAEGLEGEALRAERDAYRDQLEEKMRLQRPFLSANDRSRWCTVRALVEHGTYAIDQIIAEPNWDTIDMVKHRDRDGEPHLYSSKPPLLPTLIAGQYWLIHQVTGWTLGERPYVLGRFMLLTINVIPAIVMFVLLAALVERFGNGDWDRLFVMASATLGTFLTTFAVVLNNHLVAAVSVTVALYAWTRIVADGRKSPWLFVWAGLAAAFAAANELPALSFLGLIGLSLLVHAARPTLLYFTPAVLVVAAGFFGTNYVAHNSWRPPYAHRSENDPEDNWYVYQYTRGDNPRVIESYWQNPQGIDRGEESTADYALHMLIGHHGIFSLTPVWLLSMAGIGIWLAGGTHPKRELATGAALLTFVCLAFYLTRPQPDRNYGGMTSGFRWMFWFAPLWLTTMLPAVAKIAKTKTGQIVALALLALSVMSASYPTWNPFKQPWLANYFEYLGWVEF